MSTRIARRFAVAIIVLVGVLAEAQVPSAKPVDPQEAVKVQALLTCVPVLRQAFPVPGLKIVGVTIAEHDQELDAIGTPHYPLTAIIETRFPTYDGYKKSCAVFACAKDGSFLGALSIPEP